MAGELLSATEMSDHVKQITDLASAADLLYDCGISPVYRIIQRPPHNSRRPLPAATYFPASKPNRIKEAHIKDARTAAGNVLRLCRQEQVSRAALESEVVVIMPSDRLPRSVKQRPLTMAFTACLYAGRLPDDTMFNYGLLDLDTDGTGLGQSQQIHLTTWQSTGSAGYSGMQTMIRIVNGEARAQHAKLTNTRNPELFKFETSATTVASEALAGPINEAHTSIKAIINNLVMPVISLEELLTYQPPLELISTGQQL